VTTQEYDHIILTEDVAGTQFKKGDMGTVVDISESGAHYMVEFFTIDGQTIDVVSVAASQTRLARSTEIMLARALE